jgi:hypothetical protein
VQYPCNILQPGQAEVSALAQVLFREVLARCQVGVPVAATTLFGFLARGIAVALAHESKGGDLIEPGKPGGTVRDNWKHPSVTGLIE